MHYGIVVNELGEAECLPASENNFECGPVVEHKGYGSEQCWVIIYPNSDPRMFLLPSLVSPPPYQLPVTE